jgi:phosphoglycolate phosphatase-like HAD superfamily hydrolase
LTAGLLDPELFLGIAKHNRIEGAEAALADYTVRYFAELETELALTADRVKVMPGIIPLLENLQNSTRAVAGILTGNFRRATELKLKAAGLDGFNFPAAAFGEDAARRADLVAAALQQFTRVTGHSASAARTVIVGDTPRDLAAARAAGCRVLAVATGAYSLEQLQAEQPDAAVEDLLDPKPLYDLIARMPA